MSQRNAFNIRKDNRYMIIDSRTGCVHVVKADNNRKAYRQVLRSTNTDGLNVIA